MIIGVYFNSQHLCMNLKGQYHGFSSYKAADPQIEI